MVKRLQLLLRLPALVTLMLLTMVISLFSGAFPLEWQEVCDAFLMIGDEAKQYLVLHIRLPRIILGGLVGAGLACAGAAIQGLFRNPLADQTLIGVSSGAMLFAVLSIVLMGSILASLSDFFQQTVVAIAAFVGGVTTTYVVYILSRKSGKTSVMTMLLAGIAISAFASAITGVFIYLSDDQQLRDITFWSLGSLGGATWQQIMIVGPVVLGGIILLIQQARSFNAILLGEQEASYLGIPVESVKRQTIFITALIVGVCISMSGLIGFIGLVIPHLLRLLRGTEYRYLLQSSAIVGALFLVVADTLARTIIAPAELPIGILTALVGAPFFMWLLVRQQKSYAL